MVYEPALQVPISKVVRFNNVDELKKIITAIGGHLLFPLSTGYNDGFRDRQDDVGQPVIVAELTMEFLEKAGNFQFLVDCFGDEKEHQELFNNFLRYCEETSVGITERREIS